MEKLVAAVVVSVLYILDREPVAAISCRRQRIARRNATGARKPQEGPLGGARGRSCTRQTGKIGQDSPTF